MGKTPQSCTLYLDSNHTCLESLSQTNLGMSETHWPCGKCQKDPAWVMQLSSSVADEESCKTAQELNPSHLGCSKPTTPNK